MLLLLSFRTKLKVHSPNFLKEKRNDNLQGSNDKVCVMSQKGKYNVVGLVSLGFFLVLVGVIFVITPNAYTAARNFVGDFELVRVNENVFLPAPVHPSRHKVVYTAVEQFCLVWGIFQIVLLISRFVLRDTVHRKAETFSGIIFWLGVAYAASLLIADTVSWFGFWAWILIFVGLTVIARSLVVLLYELMHRRE